MLKTRHQKVAVFVLLNGLFLNATVVLVNKIENYPEVRFWMALGGFLIFLGLEIAFIRNLLIRNR